MIRARAGPLPACLAIILGLRRAVKARRPLQPADQWPRTASGVMRIGTE